MAEHDELGKTLVRTSQEPVARAEGGREPLPVQAEGRYAVPAGIADPELGRGGMGRVLRLHDTHLGREVAVKELLPEHADPRSPMGALMETLFVREARVLARLEHPGVVPVYELARRPDGTPYYAMRRIHGRPLSQVLDACASLGDRLALLQHALHVVQAVGFAHSRGVVHRDLKPDNVMVSAFGETQVIDWGLAVVQGQPLEGGVTAGTPEYMAPEQAAGTQVDARSDVWSLGVMLFEVLAGKRPFSGPSASVVLSKVQTGAVPLVTSIEPKAPRALVAVVQRALERDPSRRYADAGAMADALEAAMRTPLSRPTAWIAAALSLGLLLGLVSLWGVTRSSQAQEAVARALRDVDEARRETGEASALAAVAALRARDSSEADRLARNAVAASGSPLGHGVLMLAAERGVPERRWSVKVPAGCSAVAAAGDLVGCSTLNGVALFALPDGASRGELSTGLTGWQHGLAARGTGQLISGGDDKRVHVWDVASRKDVHAWTVDGLVSAVGVDGEEAVAGLRSGAVLRLSPSEGARRVGTHPGPVRVVAGRKGATASASAAMLLLDARDETAQLDRAVGSLIFLDARHLVAGVERSVVRFDGTNAGSLSPAGRDDVRALAVLPVEGGASRVVSGDAAGVVRWYFDDGSVEGELDAFAPGVQALGVASDGAVLVATVDKRLEAWVLPPRARPASSDGVPTVQAVSPRGWLLTGLRDGHVRRLALDSGEEGVLELRHTAAVRGLAEVAGDERPERLRLLSGGDDGLVQGQRWNGAVDVVDSRPGQKVTGLAASRDGQRAAWTFDDGAWALWSLQFGKEIARGQGPVARAVTFSADGRAVALGREDKRVQVLDAETGREVAVLEPVDAAVTSVALSNDGALLAAGSADGRVTLWDVASRRAVRQLNQPRARVSSVDVSPDGRLVAAGSDDGDTWLWDAASGALLARVPADAGDAMAVAFLGPRALVSVGTDRVVHRWTLPVAR